ncbi:hypothetical protein LTR37_021148, partial [Vermiconidia calcicola]
KRVGLLKPIVTDTDTDDLLSGDSSSNDEGTPTKPSAKKVKGNNGKAIEASKKSKDSIKISKEDRKRINALEATGSKPTKKKPGKKGLDVA